MLGNNKSDNTVKIVGLSLAAVVLTAAIFIGGKKLFQEEYSYSGGQGEKTSPEIFAKQDNDRFALVNQRQSSAIRTDSIAMLSKANEGYTSSQSNNSQDQEYAAKNKAGQSAASSIDEFSNPHQAELGQAENQPASQAAGQGAWGKSGGTAGQESAASTTQGVSSIKSQTRNDSSSASGKKSAFSNKLSSMVNFSRNSRLGKSYGSGNEESSSSQESSSFAQGGNYSNSSNQSQAALGANNSSSSGMSGSSSNSSNSNSGNNSSNRTDTPQKEKPDLPRPQMLVYKQVQEFGDVNRYEVARRLIVVMNVGKKNLHISKINRADADSAFYLSEDKCKNTTLTPGKECTFQIRFRPYASREFSNAFEVESNDTDKIPYSNYIEVSGKGKSYYYSSSLLYNNQAATTLNFGTVTAEHSLELAYLFRNNTGKIMRDITFHRMANASYSVTYSNCPKELEPWQYCVVKVKLSPKDIYLKGLSSNYGKYHSVNAYNGKKEIVNNPAFPPRVVDSPFEIKLDGYLQIKAKTGSLTTAITIINVPMKATVSARYPHPKLKRIDKYYSF